MKTNTMNSSNSNYFLKTDTYQHVYSDQSAQKNCLLKKICVYYPLKTLNI